MAKEVLANVSALLATVSVIQLLPLNLEYLSWSPVYENTGASI
jgi:hypothetical protein